ncbi:dopamine receptor 1-like [Neocloeon triangulifer]|uniref:dopamine receptor 1-like n=1 Tax=Neocloeon triangulifer TaxID=2078957 RepID=UPI00286F9058|nr:dopamine receptor 1-like [Neocloeon triangulifer]
MLSNFTILATVWLDQRLRSATCWFICSLAVADLVVLTCAVPLAALQDLRGHWPYGEVFCDVWIVVDLTFSTASLLSILLLAIDKYMSVKFPFTYSQKMTTKVLVLVLGGVWCGSLMSIAIPVWLNHHQHHLNLSDVPQEDKVCLAKFMPHYSLLLSLLDFVLPCAIMVYIYSRLYLQAKETADEIKAVKRSLECNYVTSEESSKKPSITRLQRFRYEFKAALTVGFIMGSYLICWMPFFIVEIWSSFDDNCCSDLTFKVVLWISYVNSAINPMIYGLMDKKIRLAFKSFIWQSSIIALPRLSIVYRDSVSR